MKKKNIKIIKIIKTLNISNIKNSIDIIKKAHGTIFSLNHVCFFHLLK